MIVTLTQLNIQKLNEFLVVSEFDRDSCRWADVLRTQLPVAEIYNVGCSGAGNTYISAHYSAYDKKYKFTEHDLILILWSTFMREDK